MQGDARGEGGGGERAAIWPANPCLCSTMAGAGEQAGGQACVRACGAVGGAGGLLLRTAIGAVLAELPLRPGEAILRHFRLGVRVPVVRAAPVVVRRVAPLWRPKERWGWVGSDLQRGVRRGECTLGVHS